MNRSAILTYHSLDDSGSVISMAPEVFRDQMQWLAESGIPVLPLAQAWQSPGSVALTFDDGAVNFADHAVPVLERFGFPATVFVVSGLCGKRSEWTTENDIPVLDLMSWEELRGLPSSVEVGSHTVRHRNLTRLPEAEVEEELRISRMEIEDHLGRAVRSFAYPYGAANRGVMRMAAGHYRIACGTRLQFVTPKSRPEHVPRLDVYYLRRAWWFRRFHRFPGRAYLALRDFIREFRS